MGYAPPTSRKYLAWYMQQNRKKRQAAAAVPSAVTRYLTRLDATQTQYYTIPTWTASGDFEIRILATIPSPNDKASLGNNDALNFLRLRSSEANQFDIRMGGSGVGFTYNHTVGDSKLHDIIVRRVSGIISATVDGVATAPTGPANIAGTLTLDRIGTLGGAGQYQDGYLANVSLDNKAGDKRFYKLDENFGETSVVKDSLATLGSELWDSLDFSITGPYVGTFTNSETPGEWSTGYAGVGPRSSINLLEEGITYLIDAQGVSANTQLKAVHSGGQDDLLPVGQSGIVVYTGPSGGAQIYFRASASGSHSISSISTKQAPGYGEAINLAESQLFTEVADGLEGVDQSITSTPLLGDGSDPELIHVVISITQNQVYRVNATFDQVLTDTSDAGWITNRGIPSTSPWRKIPVIGESVGGDFTCTSTGPLEVYGRAAATISYKNVSVKEFLEVAT